MTKFTVPLLGNTTLTVDSSLDKTAQPLPLVVMALDSLDPWSMALSTSESSIDQFLSGVSSSAAHYLFLDYDSGGNVEALQEAFTSRMEALGFNQTAVVRL
jgi:hypothetical protein